MGRDAYLAKIKLDIDSAEFNKVIGTISKEIISAGKISSDFTNNALELARKYNEEISKQSKIMANAKKNILSAKTDVDKRFWREVYKSAQEEKKAYVAGDTSRGLKSKAEVDAVAQSVAPIRSKLMPISNGLNKLRGAFDKSVAVFSKASAIYEAASLVFQQISGKLNETLGKFANYAGQLNPLGAFGSQTIRGYMTRYGMSSTQAMGFANTLDAMGLSESDIGNMTADQRRVFNELQSYWGNLMGTMDPDKVKKFTKTMEQYQLIQAKFNMGMQAVVMKLITNSPKFEQFMGKLENLMDSTLNFLGSDLVQSVFNGLIDFLSQVATWLSNIMNTLSKIPFLSSGTSTTTNNTTTNNSINVYGSDYRSNDELARQLSYAINSGGYRG